MLKFKNLKLFILDNDDVLFESSPLIQYHVERNWPKYSKAILQNRERMVSIVQYQYDQINNIIENARKNGEIPNIPNFNVNRNDVIRETDTVEADFEDKYYRRPLLEIGQVLEQAKYDKEMFLENRDATVEKDGKLDIIHGLIPYHEIYREDNWFPYTKENVNQLYDVFGERLISLTAHNGIDDNHGREFEAKENSLHQMNPNIKHYGLRFHKTEHIDGVRRPRNSKAEKIQNIYGLDDLNGVVILDDSMANCLDIYNHGGTPILYNPLNNPNPYGFAMVRSTKPESIFRELSKTGFDTEKTLQKPKVLVR